MRVPTANSSFPCGKKASASSASSASPRRPAESGFLVMTEGRVSGTFLCASHCHEVHRRRAHRNVVLGPRRVLRRSRQGQDRLRCRRHEPARVRGERLLLGASPRRQRPVVLPRRTAPSCPLAYNDTSTPPFSDSEATMRNSS